MDINFPLILVCVVLATGLVAAVDRLFLRAQRKPGAKEPAIVDFSRSFFPVLLLVLVLRSFLVEPFKIPSSSMVPTLLVNDFILVNKYIYGLRLPVTNTKIVSISEPKRGDVMVFFPPGDPRYFIKRVVGLPGDEIRYVDNVLYINGVGMKQEFVSRDAGNYLVMKEQLVDRLHLLRKADTPGPLGQLYPNPSIGLGTGALTASGAYKVPEGHYFMMGDNRDNSSDSRVWGPVPEANIVGKAFAVWMHWESLFSLPKFSRSGKIT